MIIRDNRDHFDIKRSHAHSVVSVLLIADSILRRLDSGHPHIKNFISLLKTIGCQ